MNPSDCRVRRATLDDIGALKALWESMRYPTGDLEKRLTEFQVVEGADGKIVGALGFQIVERQARIHSEAFTDFAIADAMRPVFLKRIQSLATNHGVVRLWTQEHAPFWARFGFQPAGATALEKLPSVWDRSAADWLIFQTRDEDAIASADKEFALFMATEKQRTAQAFAQAKKLKAIAIVFVCIVALAVFAAAAYLYFIRRGTGSLTP
jgi:N-acetylglutamate synthase-like GNAT family acetyltransferase